MVLKDVALECEQFLGPKGFTAVQISPPMEHIQGEQWWTRYQPVSYKLISRSGNENEFIDMVQRCSKVGVGIYADAVINHIVAGSGVGVGGTSYGNRANGNFGQNDMHHQGGLDQNCQVSNYADRWNVQECDLVGLPDLCTECPNVQKTVAEYINRMTEIGITGIRIDAAKHQDASALGQLLSTTSNALFRFQEVISGGGEAVKPEMYFAIGRSTEFQYFRELVPNFLTDGKLQYLESFGEKWGFIPSGDAVVFIDNHDTQRGNDCQLNYKNGKMYELVNIFMLAHPYGYPKIMSSYYFDQHDQGPPSSSVHGGSSAACGGQPTVTGLGSDLLNASGLESGGWVCEHRWTGIANMVAWRKSAAGSSLTSFQSAGPDTIAFCRGNAACVALNRQDGQSWQSTLKFTIPSGQYCNVIHSDDPATCQKVSVSADGSVELDVPQMSAVAVHIGKKISTASGTNIIV